MAKKHDWPALKAEFITSTLDQRAFATSKGVNASTLMSRANKGKWEEERKQYQAQTSKRAVEAKADDAVAELVKFNEDDLKVARALRSQVATAIHAAQTKKTALSATELRALAGTAEAAQKIGRLALGANTESMELAGRNGGAIAVADVPLSPEEFRKIAQGLANEI